MSGFDNDVVYAKNADFTQSDNQAVSEANGLATDGQLWIGRTAVNAGGTHIDVNTITAGTGITVTNGPGSITIASTAVNTDLHTARFIVASSTAGTGANFTTIASAITAAVATGINSTIFLQPGTYTENLTLPANINLCAFICDAYTPNVTISGTITKTTAGSSSISGIRLQTNSAALLAVTGSAASIVNLNDCYLNCTNTTGITFSVANTGSSINITNCSGDLGTTGIGIFSHSSTGLLFINNSRITNTGGSSTASTCSAGILNMQFYNLASPITMSSTGSCTFEHGLIDTSGQNATCLTLGGGVQTIKWARFTSGSASAVSIGTVAGMEFCAVNSTNTNAITGAGTLSYSPVSFDGTSSTVNTTTQTPLRIGPRIYTNGGISFDGGTNLLSTYTVGTFTPTMVGGSTAGTTTYTAQNGYYVRVGAVVTAQATVQGSAATGTGNIVFGFLPFTIKSQTNGRPTGSIYQANQVAKFPYIAGTTYATLVGAGATTQASIYNSGTAVVGGFQQMDNGSFDMEYSLTYEI